MNKPIEKHAYAVSDGISMNLCLLCRKKILIHKRRVRNVDIR